MIAEENREEISEEVKTESRTLFEYMAPLAEFDHIFTLDCLSEVLGRRLETNRAPLQTVRIWLEKECKRTLVPERGIGYRVCKVDEIPNVAVGRVKRAGRQVSAGVRTVSYADRSAMTPQQRRELDDQQRTLAHLKLEVARHKRQLERHEEVLDEHQQRLDGLDAIVEPRESLEERLERVEALLRVDLGKLAAAETKGG